MTKCPQCGKDLQSDDVLIRIEDPSGKNADCFHMNKLAWDEFSKKCQIVGTPPDEMLFRLMAEFLEHQKKDKARISRKHKKEKT